MPRLGDLYRVTGQQYPAFTLADVLELTEKERHVLANLRKYIASASLGSTHLTYCGKEIGALDLRNHL